MNKVIIILCLCLTVSFANAQVHITEKIDSLLKGLVDESEPGLSVGIIKEDRIIYTRQIGMANLEYDIPNDGNTKFPIASISKQITAASIGTLERMGLLSIDDDVRKYVPELPGYGAVIRIKHLLNHTSGLRNYNVLLDLQGFDYEHTGYTNKSIETLIFKQQGVNNEAGEKMLYSNSNYVLLALIVQRVSGKPIYQFAQEELFKPLGMENTSYRNSLFEILKNPAYTYYKSNNTYQQHNSANICVGAGGVVTTVPDLLNWSRIFWVKDHSKAWLSTFLITQDTLNNGLLSNYGRGVFLDDYINLKTIHHGGRDYGLRTILLVVPEYQISIVVFANSSEINASGIAYQILDIIFPENITLNSKIKSFEHKASNVEHITGDYQELNSDMGMKIFVENDTVKAKSSMGRNSIPLKGVERNIFQRMDNASVRHTFFDNNDQNCDMTVDFGGATFYFEKVILVDPALVDLNEYVGSYYSEELDVTYIFKEENKLLVLDYPNNVNLSLQAGQKDEFGSGRRTRYTFIRNDSGEVDKLYVAAEGTVKNISFVKFDSNTILH